MFSKIRLWLADRIFEFAAKYDPNTELLCRLEKPDVSVYRKGEDYILIWNKSAEAKNYDAVAYVTGKTLFYLEDKSDPYIRCWINVNGDAEFCDRQATLEKHGVHLLSHDPWGRGLAERIWSEFIKRKDKDMTSLVTYYHRDYCGQGLFFVSDEFARKQGLDGAGIGIFTITDGHYFMDTVFFWTERDEFLSTFERLTDFGMSGADQSDLYASVRKDVFSLNNQTLTRQRIVEALEEGAKS